MNNAWIKTKICMLSALGVLQAMTARAQTAGNDLNEIIVTARRVEERAQDVPISMTLFNQQQLSNNNVVESQDLAALTPSLSAENNFGAENTTFSLRGFTQDIGTQPTVGVYFADVVAPRGAANEIPIGDGAGPGSFFDLQNVQVLKGPQGTLFGRNTTGGAILLVPQKPTSTQEGYAEVSLGDYNLKRIQAVENLPLSDNARFRIGVDRMDRDGYTNNDTGTGPRHFEGVDYLAIRASLVVDLSPELENYQIFSYTLSDTTGTDQKLVACDPSNPFFGSLACPALARQQGTGFYTVQNLIPDPYTRMTQFQFINTTTWHASDLITVKNIASYAQLKEDLSDMLFGAAFNLADLSPLVAGFLHAPINLPSTQIGFAEAVSLPNGDTANESTMVEEFQLQGRTPGGRLKGQGGVYVEESDPLAATGSQSPVLITCTNLADFRCTDSSILGIGSVSYSAATTYFHNFGVYGQGTYTLTDQLKLTGGLRYTMDSTETRGQLANYGFPTPNTPVRKCTIPASDNNDCNVSYVQSGHAPTWLIDLEYTPVEDVLNYLKYTRGYRAGGVSLTSPTGYNTYQPEKVDTYEVGFKTTFHGAVSGTFDIAAFYNDFTHQQLQLNLTPTELGVSPGEATFNAGKSRIYGIEVGGSISAFTGFTLSGGYTYLNTELQSIAAITTPPGSPFIVQAPIKPGDPLTLSPKNKYSLTGTYRLPLSDAVGRIAASLNFTHTDKQLANYVDALYPGIPSAYALSTLAARNLLNADLNWNNIAGSQVDLALFGTNLTNQQYYTWVAGTIQSVGFETAQLGQPRMFGVRVRYSW
jgi:iron complex outermembrane recepter protein